MSQQPINGKVLSYDNLLREVELFAEAEQKGISRDPNAPVNQFANQFFPFIIDDAGEANEFKHTHEVEPVFEGGDAKPDVLLKLEMVHFNLGEQEDPGKKTRATMNITIKQNNPIDEKLEPLYWTATAGMDLYKLFKEGKVKEKKKFGNIDKAFGGRPIEIPGGSAALRFDVIKHPETKWWQSIFDILQSKVVDSVIDLVGLPGVTKQGIDIIDNLFDRIEKKNAEYLFQSDEVPLVLTAAAKERMLKNNRHSEIGVLKPGMFILTRLRDYTLFKKLAPYYSYSYKTLIPKGKTIDDYAKGEYIDPFKRKTYAIFKIVMVDTKLNPLFEELKLS